MKQTKHALLVGVGGQGAILTAKVLVNGLMRAGYDVKMSEVHGMSQRGGSVSTQVHWGEKVYSPVIGKGAADIVLAFEKMEAVRYSDYLKLDDAGHITSYLADVDSDADYIGDTEVVKDGYFAESDMRSAPYFDLQIDGITLLDTAF